MNYEQQKERYMNDPLFANVVNMLYTFLLDGKITVGELRDATTFAGIKFETYNVKPLFMKKV